MMVVAEWGVVLNWFPADIIQIQLQPFTEVGLRKNSRDNLYDREGAIRQNCWKEKEPRGHVDCESSRSSLLPFRIPIFLPKVSPLYLLFLVHPSTLSGAHQIYEPLTNVTVVVYDIETNTDKWWIQDFFATNPILIITPEKPPWNKENLSG